MNQQSEYWAVRENVGMFDFSLLTKIVIMGENAHKFLNFLLPKNVNYLELNRIMHTAIIDKNAKIIDIVYLYRFPDYFLLIGNPSQKEKVLQLFNEHIIPDVQIIDETASYGIIGLEGPYSFEVAKRVIGFDILGLRYLRFLETSLSGIPRVICARCGVTGEYGYRILFPKGTSEELNREIFREEPIPLNCNLEVLNALCQEVRFPYFGIFVNEGDDILELGLHWFIDFRKENYLAKEIIEEKKLNLRNRLVGFVTDEKRNFNGSGVYLKEHKIGFVKSKAWSPVLNKEVGFTMLEEEFACSGIGEYSIEKRIPITTATTPFFITKSVKTPIT